MQEKKKDVIISAPGTGDYFSVMGSNYRIAINGKQTGGDFALIEMEVPPGGGPGPHAHAGFHESFYVVEGEIEVYSETGSQRATGGMTVTIPKGGMVHSFKNKSERMARLLCYVAPAGLDKFFEKIGQPVKAGEFLPPPQPDPAAISELKKLAEEFGQEIYPPDYLDQKRT